MEVPYFCCHFEWMHWLEYSATVDISSVEFVGSTLENAAWKYDCWRLAHLQLKVAFQWEYVLEKKGGGVFLMATVIKSTRNNFQVAHFTFHLSLQHERKQNHNSKNLNF
jgi:hypothetical protein